MRSLREASALDVARRTVVEGVNAETREYVRQEISRKRLELVPKAQARPCEVPWEELTPPEIPKRYAKGRKKKPIQPPSYLAVREAPRHPSFKRVVRSICPFSGLSRVELEQHVAGILAMVDEADRRVEGEAA
jgi:hypothetical protein